MWERESTFSHTQGLFVTSVSFFSFPVPSLLFLVPLERRVLPASSLAPRSSPGPRPQPAAQTSEAPTGYHSGTLGVCTHTHTHSHAHTHTHTHTHAHTHAHTYTHTHIHAHTHIHTHIQDCLRKLEYCDEVLYFL